MENIVKRRRMILSPQKNVDWASEMVLNPAIIRDPDTGRIHMLVRVSGPFTEKRIPGKPLPFPIFFAYAWSDDNGENFEFDFSKPALSPKICYEEGKALIKNGLGEIVLDNTNGCIEDPRLFWVEGECYCTAACRKYPPGPYWELDEPTQCMPDWAKGQTNPSVTVLYKVDLKALSEHRYDEAFDFITDLTDPENGEDRDVFFFPNRMMIDGRPRLVMLQRPHHPDKYEGIEERRPSIVISAADDFYSFAHTAAKRAVLYAPTEKWQSEKVGASTPPLELGNGEWLLNYHGKENSEKGYAQSFMILKEKENDFPEITHLCKEKWIVNEAEFEKPSKFKTPCVFFTGLIKKSESELLVSYGAADEFVGVMELDFNKLMYNLRQCKKTSEIQ